MKKNRKKLCKLTLHRSQILLVLSATVFLLLFSGWRHNYAYAQTGESGLSISPVVFELNSNPGDTLTNQVKLHNPTEYPQNVKMLVEDFSPIGEEGEVVLEEPGDDSTYSLASWTTITPSNVVVEPGEQVIITFVVEVPHNAEPGGHYGSIVAFISGGSTEVTGSSIGTKRGALILLSVSGDIEEEVIVNTFSAESFQEYGPVEFDLKFENLGNVHVRPAGFITITDQFGKQVEQLEIPQNNVIPNAVRKAEVTWDETDLAGRYTATVVANYGTAEKKTVTSVTTFTVFPLKKALIIAGAVLLVLLLIFLARKRLALAFKVLIGKK